MMPQTPSRSAHARQSAVVSPSPPHKKPETPTMSRISSSFASKVGLRTPASARRLDDIRRALETSTPSGGACTSTPSGAVYNSTPSGAVCVIAHSAKAQEHFDRLSISWAVQYEIARAVSLGWWTWEEVTLEKLKLLQDPTNTAAARVSQVIRGAGNVVSPMDMAMWYVVAPRTTAFANVGAGPNLTGKRLLSAKDASADLV